MLEWVKKNRSSVIRTMFIIPIILVAAISISHVVSWYDLSNPISWAIYLSIAVEIAAMTALSAASVKVKGFSVWFVFGVVTFIQFMGNIFFSYNEIKLTDPNFKSWVELVTPVFDLMGIDSSDLLNHKRWLALLSGGLLPLISLTCIHFFVKYGGVDEVVIEDTNGMSAEIKKKELIKEESPIVEEKTEVVNNVIPENKRELIEDSIEDYILFTGVPDEDESVIEKLEEPLNVEDEKKNSQPKLTQAEEDSLLRGPLITPKYKWVLPNQEKI